MVRTGATVVNGATESGELTTAATPIAEHPIMAMQPVGECWWAGSCASGEHGAAGTEELVPACSAWVGESGVAWEWSAVQEAPAPTAAYWTAISVRTPETNLRQIMCGR